MSETEPQLDIPLGPMTAFGFPYGAPPSPSLALKAARHMIYEEQRWIHGQLMAPAPIATKKGVRLSGDAREEAKAAASCTDVLCCAVGALVIVCYNGPAIESWICDNDGPLLKTGLKPPEDASENDVDDWKDEALLLRQHPIGSRAILYLGRAINPNLDSSDQANIEVAVGDTIDLNDSGRSGSGTKAEAMKHLRKVAAAFDSAIALAEADERALVDDLHGAIDNAVEAIEQIGEDE